MEQEEVLYKKIKDCDAEDNKEFLKDIVMIDGAIVEDEDIDYKNKVYNDIEKKYFVKLSKLKYNLFQDRLEHKVDKYVESQMKDINTKLGLLKLFLIRMAAIELFSDDNILEIVNKIFEEDRYKKVKELYEKLDDILINEK